MEDIRARIEQEVGSWEGVRVRPHRFGGVEFVVGERELGHIHPEGWVDLPFTRRIREMLLETGRAEPHRAGVTGWSRIRSTTPRSSCSSCRTRGRVSRRPRARHASN